MIWPAKKLLFYEFIHPKSVLFKYPKELILGCNKLLLFGEGKQGPTIEKQTIGASLHDKRRSTHSVGNVPILLEKHPFSWENTHSVGKVPKRFEMVNFGQSRSIYAVE
jgi:hypothetical protein